MPAGCTAILQGTFLRRAEHTDAYTYQLSLLMKLSPQILLFLKGSNQLTLAKTQQVHSEQCVLEVRPVVIILKTERSAFKTFYGMKKFTAGVLYC